MKITLVTVGKIKEKYLKDAIAAVSYTHLDVYKRQEKITLSLRLHLRLWQSFAWQMISTTLEDGLAELS